jgi:hypothetical protein
MLEPEDLKGLPKLPKHWKWSGSPGSPYALLSASGRDLETYNTKEAAIVVEEAHGFSDKLEGWHGVLYSGRTLEDTITDNFESPLGAIKQAEKWLKHVAKLTTLLPERG